MDSLYLPEPGALKFRFVSFSLDCFLSHVSHHEPTCRFAASGVLSERMGAVCDFSFHLQFVLTASKGTQQHVSIIFAKIGLETTIPTKGKIRTAFMCSPFALQSIIPDRTHMEFMLAHTLFVVAV